MTYRVGSFLTRHETSTLRRRLATVNPAHRRRKFAEGSPRRLDPLLKGIKLRVLSVFIGIPLHRESRFAPPRVCFALVSVRNPFRDPSLRGFGPTRRRLRSLPSLVHSGRRKTASLRFHAVFRRLASMPPAGTNGGVHDRRALRSFGARSVALTGLTSLRSFPPRYARLATARHR
jgi:hypothetical protein